MKLYLLSEAGGGRLVLDVRFDDEPGPAGGVPVDLGLFADAAHERVRSLYPSSTYEFARESRLLDLPGWAGQIALYWLLPFSERSPMRTRLIEELYRLTLIEAAILKYHPEELVVTGEDDGLARVITRLGERHALPVRFSPPRPARGARFRRWRHRAGGMFHLLLRRLALLRDQWRAWWFLRGQARQVTGDLGVPSRGLIAFYTRYPALWEFPSGGEPRERNFGTFPAFLAAQGYEVVYPAVLSGPVSAVRSDHPDLVAHARRRRIVFLESLLTFREFLTGYLDIVPVWRYLQWRRVRGRAPICFDGLDVSELVLRQLDEEVFHGAEILLNFARARGLERFCRTHRPQALFHPFEYQPMERAVCVGVKSGCPNTTVVGVQTGIFSSTRPGWYYGEGEVAMPAVFPAFHAAPFPDYLSVYGTLAKAVFSRQCPPDRILLTGAIRYPDLQEPTESSEPGAAGRDLVRDVRILIAATINKDETRLLLRAAAELVRARREIALLVKFHHHNPMHEEAAILFDAPNRVRIVDTALTSLLRESRAVLLGWSSTGVVVEAIAAGCMPVVLQPPDRYSYGSSADARDAIFLCADTSALAEAVRQCVDHSPGYSERRRAWPETLEKMACPLDGRQNERLFHDLTSRGVL